MKRVWAVLIAAVMMGPGLAWAGDAVTEDFETGFADGEPLRQHGDWFYEEPNEEPTCENGAGIGGGWGVGPGDRAFTWTAKPFRWSDPKLVAVTFGGDWQTDEAGRLDDDRAGWSISNEDDSSDNTFGVQLDPIVEPQVQPQQPQQGGGFLGSLFGGSRQQPAEEAAQEPSAQAAQPETNIEAYWDGETVGDDGCRTTIAKLPTLKPETWYRLRAKFTKLSATSAKIEVTFVELDDSGKPTGKPIEGTLADTSKLPGTDGNATPNEAYFTTSTVWPVFKNYYVVGGGFDNAYFEIEKSDASEDEAEVKDVGSSQ